MDFYLRITLAIRSRIFYATSLRWRPASNTLGWRWVAGIQTQGKHYLASEWNIKKFTNNRFNNIKLNENATPKVSDKTYSIVKQDFSSKNIDDKNLFIFENNLSFETTDFQNEKFEKIYIISNRMKTDLSN